MREESFFYYYDTILALLDRSSRCLGNGLCDVCFEAKDRDFLCGSASLSVIPVEPEGLEPIDRLNF